MPSALYAKAQGAWQQVFPEPYRGVAPTLSAVAGDTQIIYTWTAATGITPTSYEFEFGGVIETLGNVLTLTKAGLTNGTQYSARVRGVTAANVKGEWSTLVSATPQPFVAGTGGVETTFTKNGTETWKRHTFLSGTTPKTFTVTTAGLFTVTVVGGGAGGSGNPDGFGRGPTGGNGGFHSAETTLTAGAKTVTVGSGGNPGASQIIGGGGGSNGGNGTVSSLEGSFTGGGGQAGQAFNAGVPATAPAGNPAPAANGGVTAIDHAGHGLATTVGTGGTGGGYNMGGPNAGNSGAVVIEYRIA